MTHPGGAPRTVSYPPDDMISLGEEMIKWVKDNDPVHLSQFYTIHKGYTYKQWKTFIQKPEFIPYYEKALKMVGIKYLVKDSKIISGIAERWQRVYFGDLKEEEDETLELKSKISSASQNQIPPLDLINEKDNKIMELEAKLEAALNDNKSKTE